MRKILPVLILSLFALNANARTPIIGISSGSSDVLNTLKITYPTAVFRAGGIPVILPEVRNIREAEELLSTVDAVIFSGGEDIDPEYYGEKTLNSTVEINAKRDTSDFFLVKAALNSGKPILGICRGCQLLAVALGGSLWQDIPSQIPSDIQHRQSESATVPTHWVSIEKDSGLHSILGRDSVFVNTKHHQAVKTVGRNSRVSAKAPDGVIEGWEAPGIVCVQFHPEAMVSAGDDTLLPILADLVKRASAKR